MFIIFENYFYVWLLSFQTYVTINKDKLSWEIPGSPVVWTLYFHCPMGWGAWDWWGDNTNDVLKGHLVLTCVRC